MPGEGGRAQKHSDRAHEPVCMTLSPRLGHPDCSTLHKNQGRRFPGGFWLLPLGQGACKPSKGWGLGGDRRRPPGGGLLVQRGKQGCSMEKPAWRSNSNSTTEGLDRDVNQARGSPRQACPRWAPGCTRTGSHPRDENASRA